MPALAAILAFAAVQASPAASVQGYWKSPGGNSIIFIAPCGPNLCGTVAWASAKAKSDASKTVSQLVGTALLTNLHQDTKGLWRGKLFIPDQNMHVTAKLQLAGPEQLKVSGCAAGRALCKSYLWTRTAQPPAS